MGVSIDAIKFNHDPNSATNDALNIRKSKSAFVKVPEWEKGKCTKHDDSRAAYAIKETAGKTLTIQARFSGGPAGGEVDIRAVDSSQSYPGKPGCVGAVLSIIAKIIQAVFGNALGEVKERKVKFDAKGDSGFVSFELVKVSLSKTPVGIRYTEWTWQWREGKGAPWIDIETTRHKIYVVLEVPKAPWVQQPYNAANDQLPWTDVMDYSCVWAIGAKDRDFAAAKITECVNVLGPARIRYDTSVGATNYARSGSFRCTRFLERLDGKFGLGEKVNCTDCATITSTFSNVLGCDLWQSRMGANFALNEIIAIGFAAWKVPFFGSFSYHEVAWEGACGRTDDLYDACLKVDGGLDPWNAPHPSALLPVNTPFGTCGGKLDYVDRLTTKAGCLVCNPTPMTRQRRPVE